MAAVVAKQLERAAVTAVRLGQGQQRTSENAQKMPRDGSEEQQGTKQLEALPGEKVIAERRGLPAREAQVQWYYERRAEVLK